MFSNIFITARKRSRSIQYDFVKNLTDYPLSSYFFVIFYKKSSIEKDKLIYQFDTKENFIDSHQQKKNTIAL